MPNNTFIMEFGRELLAFRATLPEETSFVPNLFIQQGENWSPARKTPSKGFGTPIWAAFLQAEALEFEQRNLLAADELNLEEKKIYELLRADEPRQIDDIVEKTGLNSSEVLATLFNLELKGIIRQLPGKQFTKVFL